MLKDCWDWCALKGIDRVVIESNDIECLSDEGEECELLEGGGDCQGPLLTSWLWRACPSFSLCLVMTMSRLCRNMGWAGRPNWIKLAEELGRMTFGDDALKGAELGLVCLCKAAAEMYEAEFWKRWANRGP
nr:hypothetical protein Itr_chr11CG00020 [Ipomoea trifida]